MSEDSLSKHDHVLAGLVMSLQAAAMQQLGKITNPMTGQVERDLDQARQTIDLLEMLKVKCRTDTPEPLLRLMDQSVMDLQMNYVDERHREAQEATEESETSTETPAKGQEEEPTEAEAAAGTDSEDPETDGSRA